MEREGREGEHREEVGLNGWQGRVGEWKEGKRRRARNGGHREEVGLNGWQGRVGEWKEGKRNAL